MCGARRELRIPMHIPDGYLSPSTCAALYASSAPFWYAASRRVARDVGARLIPLVSVFSAFSFVIMMFNLPLPGGTTGHATGAAVAAIVLGPWGSILAVSAALLIQALFFGDGGITALGANCFNMAIVGSLTAYFSYRLLAGKSAITSRRRVWAAGAAGYVSINVAALLAAVQFGIQPMFFTDASGAPLYAPYPLGIAVPAMMVGHVTIAGFAELVVTAGLVAYMQRSRACLLEATAPGAITGEKMYGVSRPWRELRPLLAVLAVILLMTPLGVLAVGTAWGEWSPKDFTDAAARHQIAAASGSVAPPGQVPRGLDRLAAVWTAPFPDYSPPVLRSASLGYLLSGAFGVGLILLVALVVDWALSFPRKRA
jgi:cobalt/nickel transport system permease protein